MTGHPNEFAVILCDTIEGGASGSTARMLLSLESQGLPLERWHFTPGKPTSGKDIGLEPGRKRPPFERILKNFSRSLADDLRHARHEHILQKQLEKHTPSLINIRNIHSCGLNHNSLLNTPPSIPLVWTLHDAWPVTTSAFEWIDERQGTTDYSIRDLPLPDARRRRDHFFERRSDIVLVSPSRWLQELAGKHYPHIRCEHIPNGVDPSVFHPLPKDDARQYLQLDPKRIWIGMASTWANSRKGPDILLDAVADLDDIPLGLLVWGGEPQYEVPENCQLRYLGRLRETEALAEAYSACDLFCCPSRADNLPNTVLESMACQTPVIGTPIGGIPDMVIPGKTGWLMGTPRADACTKALRQAIHDRQRWPDFQMEARATIVDQFHVEKTAARYRALFEELTDRSA